MDQFSVTPEADPGEISGTYKVAFSVTVIDKIPRISSGVICKGIPFPISLVRRVRAHKVLQFVHVYASTVDAIAWAQDCVDILDQLMEII